LQQRLRAVFANLFQVDPARPSLSSGVGKAKALSRIHLEQIREHSPDLCCTMVPPYPVLK